MLSSLKVARSIQSPSKVNSVKVAVGYQLPRRSACPGPAGWAGRASQRGDGGCVPDDQQPGDGGVGLADVAHQGVGALVVEVVEILGGSLKAEGCESLPGPGGGRDQCVLHTEFAQQHPRFLSILDACGQQFP
jgi:hypothetical protein